MNGSVGYGTLLFIVQKYTVVIVVNGCAIDQIIYSNNSRNSARVKFSGNEIVYYQHA
jgi:hypothetical protein